jgi:hypothetical protein
MLHASARVVYHCTLISAYISASLAVIGHLEYLVPIALSRGPDTAEKGANHGLGMTRVTTSGEFIQ